MVHKKAEEIIKRLQEENKTFVIQITGNEENKLSGFTLLLHSKEGFS